MDSHLLAIGDANTQWRVRLKDTGIGYDVIGKVNDARTDDQGIPIVIQIEQRWYPWNDVLWFEVYREGS